MRRAPRLTLGLATLALAATGLADVAWAQSAPPQYLRWAGRPEATGLPTTEAAPQPTTRPRRSNRVIPHGGAVATGDVAAPAPAPRTLTPANAWLRPVPAPPPAAPAPAPVPAAPQPVPFRTLPDYIPEQGGRGQPVPAEIALPPAPVAAADAAAAAADPMAPRRDAPIFRLQQSAGPIAPHPQAQAETRPGSDVAIDAPRPVAIVAANPDDRPAAQSPRYYSLHRQAGRQPDPVSIPAPTYVDALTVTTPVTLASQDLAQPEPGPTLIRDNQGRTRVQPAAPEGDYQ